MVQGAGWGWCSEPALALLLGLLSGQLLRDLLLLPSELLLLACQLLLLILELRLGVPLLLGSVLWGVRFLLGSLLSFHRMAGARASGGSCHCTDGRRSQEWTATPDHFQSSPSSSSLRTRPRASMISGAAEISRGPPTCGATAHIVPSTSSGVTPSAMALPICHM